MKIMLFFIIPCLFAFGCSTVSQSYLPPVNSVFNYTRQDITIGAQVTATIEYEADNPRIQDDAMQKALEGTDFDFILMPRFKVLFPIIGKSTITVTGRGAKIK